jgi:uncharacterized protein (TIGR03663 family)
VIRLAIRQRIAQLPSSVRPQVAQLKLLLARLKSLPAQVRSTRFHRPADPPWVLWAFAAIVVVALGTRMWDLGGRALHYDELLHGYYSWRFAEGQGYSHTPLTHGPLLFHGAALTFKLLGSSDVTVRLLPALFGTALVAMPFFLRRWLGIYGALATAVLFTVSPSLLYFARFIRNDAYMAVWAVALLAIMWHYMERPRRGLLYAWIAIWALAYTTKESVFLLAGSFGLFLLILSAPALWKWVRGNAKLSEVPPAGDLLIVLGTVSLPLWAPISGLFQGLWGITLVNPDDNDKAVKSGELVRAAVETGAPAGGALYIAFFIVIVLSVISIIVGMLWNRKLWPRLIAIFVVIWLPLFTSFFTNWQGFFTGFWGSLGYWIAQQGVERASQPWYYYILGISTYEFLVAVPAIAGGVYYAIRGNLFDRTMVGWAFLTFVLFSFAGERMPWLLVGITVPMALVAGRTIGALVEAAIGAKIAPAALFAGAGLALVSPYVALQVTSSDEFASTLEFWLGLAGLLGVAITTGGIALWLRMNPAVAAVAGALGVLAPSRKTPLFAAAALGGLLVLLGFTVFVSGRASYSYGAFERPTELLVYSQTGQETSYTAECVNRIARASEIGRDQLRIFSGESDSFAWQWRWYFRDYPNLQFQFLNDKPLEAAPEADIVLFSQTVEARNKDALAGGFTRVGELNHLWWFPNTLYLKLTPKSVLSDSDDRENWQTLTDYFFDRTLNSAMYHAQGVVYVSNELAHLAEGCTSLRATKEL